MQSKSGCGGVELNSARSTVDMVIFLEHGPRIESAAKERLAGLDSCPKLADGLA